MPKFGSCSRRWSSDAAPRASTTSDDPIATGRARERRDPGADVGVLQEESPDDVMVVPESFRPRAPREEQQARHFEPAGSQDEELRADGELLPVHAGEADGANGARVAVGLD